MGQAGEQRRYWFGPKRGIGWGWSPTTWEGRVASGVALIAFLVVAATSHGAARLWGSLGIAGGLIVLSLLKGTAPGSSSRLIGEARERSNVFHDETPDLEEATRRLEERHRRDQRGQAR